MILARLGPDWRVVGLGFAALASLLPFMAAAAGIDGLWRTEPRDNGAFITVRIGACPAMPRNRCGTVAGAHGGARPDIIGEPILRDMKPKGQDLWTGGEIIRPGRGDVYRSRIRLVSAEELRVEGCVAGGLICSGQTWTRAR